MTDKLKISKQEAHRIIMHRVHMLMMVVNQLPHEQFEKLLNALRLDGEIEYEIRH